MTTSVYMAPYFDANAYQPRLREELEAAGVHVEVDDRARPLRFWLLDVLRHRPDVVHLHWTHPYFLFGSLEWLYRVPGSTLLAIVAAQLFVVQVKLAALLCDRVVWTVHNLENHERRLSWLDRWVNRQVASIADRAQVWNPATERLAVETYPALASKTTVIPHGNYNPV